MAARYVTVKSQIELDAIPLDTQLIVCIDFGTKQSPAILKNKYKYMPVVDHNYYVKILGDAKISARDYSHIEAYDNSNIRAEKDSFVMAHDNSSIWARSNSTIVLLDNDVKVRMEDRCRVLVCENGFIALKNNS